MVNGTVSLGKAKLDGGTLSGFVPSVGDKFTIIANDGSDAVSGKFAGLDQGDAFVFDSRAMKISYKGGDGNDVTLTATRRPSSAPPARTFDATHTVPVRPCPTTVVKPSRQGGEGHAVGPCGRRPDRRRKRQRLIKAMKAATPSRQEGPRHGQRPE